MTTNATNRQPDEDDQINRQSMSSLPLLPSCKTFSPFSKLAPEVRLMIWEYTWPAPRMIEATSVLVCMEGNDYYRWEQNPASEEEEGSDPPLREFTVLRLAGSLSGLLQQDFGFRALEEEEELAEDCPPPVALQVCQSSRRHTLNHYVRMQHAEIATRSFYFNPRRDVLWFSEQFTDEPGCMREVQRYYAGLDSIKTILVEEFEWVERTPEAYVPYLRGLETIQIVSDNFDEDSDYEVEDHGVEEMQRRANQCRAEFAEISIKEGWAVKNIIFSDRLGNFY
ncbi:MAG: hypothetical protein M1818_003481 [Claussenomyces sp. TS43310]|nr:MAG: hypothetical protein M1818_003481 [Claussenomyces sp. TS43310]